MLCVEELSKLEVFQQLPQERLHWVYIALRRYLGINTTWYLHSHFVWLKLLMSFMSLLCTNPSLVCVKETLSYTCIPVKPRLPELSNFRSPPAKLGVYSIKLFKKEPSVGSIPSLRFRCGFCSAFGCHFHCLYWVGNTPNSLLI